MFDTLMGHSRGTLSLGTLVEHSALSLDTGTLLWDTIGGHSSNLLCTLFKTTKYRSPAAHRVHTRIFLSRNGTEPRGRAKLHGTAA